MVDVWFTEAAGVSIAYGAILHTMLRESNYPNGKVDFGAITGKERLFPALFSLSILFAKTVLCGTYEQLLDIKTQTLKGHVKPKELAFLSEARTTEDMGLNLSSHQLHAIYGASSVWASGIPYTDVDDTPIKRLATLLRNALSHGHVECLNDSGVILLRAWKPQTGHAPLPTLKIQLTIYGLVHKHVIASKKSPEHMSLLSRAHSSWLLLIAEATELLANAVEPLR